MAEEDDEKETTYTYQLAPPCFVVNAFQGPVCWEVEPVVRAQTRIKPSYKPALDRRMREAGWVPVADWQDEPTPTQKRKKPSTKRTSKRRSS